MSGSGSIGSKSISEKAKVVEVSVRKQKWDESW
jgi:hypothetical protein